MYLQDPELQALEDEERQLFSRVDDEEEEEGDEDLFGDGFEKYSPICPDLFRISFVDVLLIAIVL